MRDRFAALAACLTFLASGCGVDDHLKSMDRNTSRMASELEADQAYIRELTEQIRLMAESLAALQKMGTSMFSLVMERLFSPQPPGPTPDIDDVLKAETKP